jgi:hypothetical protein
VTDRDTPPHPRGPHPPGSSPSPQWSPHPSQGPGPALELHGGKTGENPGRAIFLCWKHGCPGLALTPKGRWALGLPCCLQEEPRAHSAGRLSFSRVWILTLAKAEVPAVHALPHAPRLHVHQARLPEDKGLH